MWCVAVGTRTVVNRLFREAPRHKHELDFFTWIPSELLLIWFIKAEQRTEQEFCIPVHCSHEPVSDWLCSQDRVKSIFTSHLLSACGVKMPVFCFHLRTSIEFVCFEKKNTHLSICFSACFALMMYSNWPQIFVGIRNAVHSRAFSTLSEPSHVWLALWYRRKDEKHRSSEWWTLCTGTKTRLSPHQKQSCIYTWLLYTFVIWLVLFILLYLLSRISR